MIKNETKEKKRCFLLFVLLNHKNKYNYDIEYRVNSSFAFYRFNLFEQKNIFSAFLNRLNLSIKN
jgi:hypothetical protein